MKSDNGRQTGPCRAIEAIVIPLVYTRLLATAFHLAQTGVGK